MSFEFRLPDVGEGLEEAEIVEWLVQPGQEIEEDEPIVEIATDKAVVEIPSPTAGTVLELRAEPGDLVPVGHVIIVIDNADENMAETDRQAADGGARQPKGAESKEAEREGAEPATAAPETVEPHRRPVLATPATRRLARERGIDIQQVKGTGPNARVTPEDLDRFAAEQKEAGRPPQEAAQPGPQQPGSQQPPQAPKQEPQRQPLRGVRRTIAQRMARSKSTAAHVTHIDECDVTALIQLREQLAPRAQSRGVKLTYLPFIVKVAALALKQHPSLNTSLDDEAEEIVYHPQCHIGIATATEAGLMVPVLKQADRRSILELAEAIQTLTTAARNRSIKPEDLRGGTFTITNIGSIGGIASTPIINYPEAAILGVHQFQERPVVRDGEVVVRSMVNLALSFDHRLIDGHTAARFTNTIIDYLEDPQTLLLDMT